MRATNINFKQGLFDFKHLTVFVFVVVSLSIALFFVPNKAEAWTTQPPLCEWLNGVDGYGYEGWEEDVEAVWDNPIGNPYGSGTTRIKPAEDFEDADFVLGHTVGRFNNDNQNMELYIRNANVEAGDAYSKMYLGYYFPTPEIAFKFLNPESGNDNGIWIWVDNEAEEAGYGGVWNVDDDVDGDYNYIGLDSQGNAEKFECIYSINFESAHDGVNPNMFPIYGAESEPEPEPEPEPSGGITIPQLEELLSKYMGVYFAFLIAGWVILWFWSPNKWR